MRVSAENRELNPGKSLFLHWGPGSNASVERRWFGKDLPIYWWDQPTNFSNPANAFDEVVNSADVELKRLSKESKSGKVSLIAHSFGGQIAVELARRSEQHIKSITLLSCGASLLGAFINLGKNLMRELHQNGQMEESEVLRNQIEIVSAKISPETFWPMVGTITKTPGFFDLYWKNNSARQKYFSLSSEGPPIHMGAFSAITNCFFSRPQIPDTVKSISQIPIRSFHGSNDPLQNYEDEKRFWSKIFPSVKTVLVDAGHFVQFEVPSKEWMPE